MVAERGLARATVDHVTVAAGVAKGTFYIHFPDRAAFLLAMHARFRQSLEEALVPVAGSAPGPDRLLAGAAAYLEVCRAAPALRALMLESRCEPATLDAAAERHRDVARLAAADFAAMGWPNPALAGRLFCAMCAEAALVELEAGEPVPAARAALAAFLAG